MGVVGTSLVHHLAKLTGKPQGTGLGLLICKQIIEHHAERIWVQQRAGRGSTFAFTLPMELRTVTDMVFSSRGRVGISQRNVR